MSKWKPKPPQVEWQQVSRKHHHAVCDECGNTPKGYCATVTTQVNWMRGDDEVQVLCITCAVHRGHIPSPIICQAIFAALSQAERSAVVSRGVWIL